MKNFAAFVILSLFLVPVVSFAEHKSAVAGQVIASDDTGITPAHGDVCDVLHYHGTLNGVADPASSGCGHGAVSVIPHGSGDGEALPPPPVKEKGLWNQFWSWVGGIFGDDVKEGAKNVIDVAAESNGILPPGTVHDAVEIVEEATPSIVENIENIDTYRDNVTPEEDTLDLYRKPEAGLEEGSVSQRFFKWFGSLTD